jgi:hypothetical protein
VNAAEVAFVLACVREDSSATSSDVAKAAVKVRDWTEVLRLAARHRVTAFVLRAVRSQTIDLLPATMRGLVDSVAESVARSMVMGLELERAAFALGSPSRRVIALKGPGLARTAYPEPFLRPYDDIDLSVEGMDLDSVASVLVAAGFTEVTRARRSVANSRNFILDPTRTLFELHGDLLQTGLPPRGDKDRWRRASPIPGLGDVQMLAPADQLVHLGFHAHKHGFNRLIWLKDIDMVVRAGGGTLDWGLVESESRNEELQSSVWLALDLARAVLGTPVPPDLLRALRPAPGMRALYRLIWPLSNVLALRARVRSRAVQFDTAQSWRGMIPSAVFMGRRRDRVRLLAQHELGFNK